MRVALLGAMPEEIEPILECLDEVQKVTYADNTYYEGCYKGVQVVVAYSKIGKVYATMSAEALIGKFGCDIVLFSGVAGALDESLKIGDLLMATKLCQHDLDITAFGHPYGYVPEGKIFVESDKRLREIAKKVAANKKIALKEGIVATGDQFIADSQKKNWIKEHFGAAAIEMEGAAVGVVCDAHGTPFFVLRAISDAADADAGFDFDTFLESSAKRSAEFILAMVEEIENIQEDIVTRVGQDKTGQA